MSIFKPMLAGKADVARLRYPLLASPKLDGVRATVIDGQLRSRSLKPVANKHTQCLFSLSMLERLDGELILGEPTAPDVFLRTSQALRSVEGAPMLRFYVFDDWSRPAAAFSERYAALCQRARSWTKGGVASLLQQSLVNNADELSALEERWVSAGYEGVMLRDPKAPYKFGRSTVQEGYLLKLKRFDDAEALVIGIEEEMHNGNAATTDALGHTKRSGHKSGKTGKGTMGALVVRGINGTFEGVEFNIGSGFTAADRARQDWVGKTVKYKFFAIGVKDKPRHPVYLGERLEGDQ